MTTRGLFCAAPVAALLCSSTPSSAAPHTDEIDAYAFVLAVAQVVSDQCADILINRPMLDAMRTHLHIGADDDAAVRSSGNAAAQQLADRIAGPTSVRAWCDVAYQAYGPEGSILPRLMLRTESQR